MSPDNQPPTNKRTMSRVATLLGAFRLKNMPQKNKKKNNDGCLSTLFAAADSNCSVPSLLLTSLTHPNSSTTHHHDGSPEDKLKVEEHASSNLARILLARRRSTNSTQSSSTGQNNDSSTTTSPVISELPLQMLDNLKSSFLTLVDARLRAYITILARHGVNLSECPGLSQEEQQEGVLAVERKLETLINIGTGVTIDNMVTFFHLEECKNSNDGDAGDDNQQQQNEQYEVTMPLVMETTMDVSIPKIGSGSQLLTVGASAKGSLKGKFAISMNSLCISITPLPTAYTTLSSSLY